MILLGSNTVILLGSNTISYWEATLYLTGKQHYILLGSNTISYWEATLWSYWEATLWSYWEATLYLTGKQHYDLTEKQHYILLGSNTMILLGSNTISLLKTNIFLFTLWWHSFSYSCYSTEIICKFILYSVLYPSKSISSSYFTKGFNRIYIKTLEKKDRVECTIYTTSSTDVHNSLDA